MMLIRVTLKQANIINTILEGWVKGQRELMDEIASTESELKSKMNDEIMRVTEIIACISTN